ncbi:MAG: hypothetical protein L0G87_00385 [Renibacterium salmoninarum]|nr:hypothetical protein [Renibacterium salmoninarum]
MSNIGYAPRQAVTKRSSQRTWATKAAGVIVAAAVAAGASLGAAGTASAAGMTVTVINNASPSQGPIEWGQKRGLIFTGTWEGGSVTNAGMTSFFVAGQDVAVTGYCRQAGVASTAAPTTEGILATDQTAIANVLMDRYSGNPEADAAIAYQMRKRFDPTWVPGTSGIGGVVRFFNDSSAFAPYREMGERWWNEAAGISGPYTVDPVLIADGQSGTVQGSLRSAAGNQVNLGSNNLTLNGPVQFSNGSKSIGGDPNALQLFTVVGNGLASVTQRVTNLPSTAVRDFTGTGTQAKLVAANTDSAVGVSADVEVFFDMQPVATSTAKVYLEKGDKFADVIHANTDDGKASSWIRVDGKPIPARFDNQVFYSATTPADTQEIPADAQLVGTGSAIATGVGDYDTIFDAGKDTATAPGWYSYVVTFTKATQPQDLQQYFKGNFTAPYNDWAEKSIVKYEPTPSTQIGEIIEGKITDQVKMTGASPEQEIEYRNELYITTTAPTQEGTDAAPVDKTTLKTGSVLRTGDGVFPVSEDISDSWDPIVQTWLQGQTPYLCFRDSIPETKLSKEWSGKYGLSTECLKLDPPKVETKASENGTVPVELRDTGIFTGIIPSGKDVQVESYVDLFKSDAATVGSVQPICLSPLWTSEKMTVTKPGEYLYPGSYLAVDPGTYDFQETTTMTYPKDGKPVTVELSKGKCGDVNERVVAFPTGTPPTPEKPAIVKPLIPAGESVSAQSGPNTALIIGGASLALLGLVLLGVYLRRRDRQPPKTPTDP